MGDEAQSAPSEDATDTEAVPEAVSEGAAEANTAADVPSVEQLQRERAEFKDLLLRKTAEFDNYRKRIDRDRERMIKHAGAEVLEQLLPVIDELERALDVATGDDASGEDAYRRGVEIIHRQLLDLLRKYRVTPMDAVGSDFDPHIHQAVVHEPSTTHRDGEVTVELRRGYMLGDNLLRAAMVKVAKRE